MKSSPPQQDAVVETLTTDFLILVLQICSYFVQTRIKIKIDTSCINVIFSCNSAALSCNFIQYGSGRGSALDPLWILTRIQADYYLINATYCLLLNRIGILY